MSRPMTKRLTVSIGVVSALALATGAFAYFTTAGSGTGTATVGSSASTIVIKGSTSGALFPSASSPVEIMVKNTGTQSAHVGSVSLTGVAADSGHSSCETSHSSEPVFTMTAVSIEKTLKSGEEVKASGSLQMKDTGVSQDGCQGATLPLNFTSN